MSQKKTPLFFGALGLCAAYVLINVVYQRSQQRVNQFDEALVLRGQHLSDNCTACHYLDQKANFVGPHLVDLIGRPVGDVSDYPYSLAIKQLKGTWTSERLTQFLSNPQAYAPGTKMTVRGWPPEEVRAIVAFLNSKS